jgi:iron complex outermembrane receptor protein
MKNILILAALFCSVHVTAQMKKIRVIDASTQKPVEDATVKFADKGGTTSDMDGYFIVNCNQVNQITISYIGYQSLTTNITCDGIDEYFLIPLENMLNNVEITSTSNENKSLLYQPTSITKLSSIELKRNTGLYLDDAINGNVPGVTMNRRAVGSGQQFNIRGYGNGARGTRGVSSNFDGQGYKVYLNGIPITDAEGITTMDDIDFGSIGNVEVVKGPSGTLYGLAIAGVVNLKTITPEKGKTSIGQDVLIGNYGLQRYTTHFAMAKERSSLLVNYGHQESSGYVIHNASQKDFVNIMGEFQPNNKQIISAYFGYSKSYDQRNGELTFSQYNNDDFSGNINYIKNDAHSELISFRVGFSHTYNFTENISNTTTVFGTGITNNASSAGGWTDRNAVNYGLRSIFSTKFIVGKGITLSGLTGVETQYQNGQTLGYNTKQSPYDNQTSPTNPWVYGRPYFIINGNTSNNATETGTTSIFTEWTLALPNDLSITAGIGISNMKINLDDRFSPVTVTKPSHYRATYNQLFSPHIAINKVFSKQFSLYASYSKGYKAPVSSYFYIVTPSNVPPITGRVNSSLNPEIGNQYEVGTKGALLNGKLFYQLAVFRAIFSNKFTTIAVPYDNTTTLYSFMVNGGKQDDKGIEALLKYTVYESTTGFFRSISPFANLTYSDFKYNDFEFHTIIGGTKDSTIDYSNKAVAGVSKVVANMGIDFETSYGIYGNMNYMYKGGMPITSDGLLNADAYSLVNAKIGVHRSLSTHLNLDIYFGVNNITNTKHPIMVFINQIPDAYVAGPRYANYYGGLNLKYNF